MRLLALALVLASAALGQTRTPRIRSNGGLSKRFPNPGGNPVLLQFLPNAISASEECTGTALTATNGAALTFTRGSAAFCTKTDGTLVSLTNNLPRLQGTGLRVERTATNLAIRSAEFESAAWTMTNVTAPSANSQVAPDGNTTAELLTSTVNGGFAASTTAAINGAHASASVYVKTTAGTQAMAIILRDTTAAADKCTGTVTATTTYQRVSCISAITTGNSHSVRIYPGGVAGTGTVVAWGAQQEAGPATSYIATAGTSVSRSGDIAYLAWPVPSNSNISMSADVCLDSAALANYYPSGIVTATNAVTRANLWLVGDIPGWRVTSVALATDTGVFSVGGDAAAAGACRHLTYRWDNAARTAYGAVRTSGGSAIGSGTSLTNDAAMTDLTRAYLGYDLSNSGRQLDGVISNLCIGRSIGACL